MARREKKPVHKVVMTEGEYSRAMGSSAIIRFYLPILTKM